PLLHDAGQVGTHLLQAQLEVGGEKQLSKLSAGHVPRSPVGVSAFGSRGAGHFRPNERARQARACAETIRTRSRNFIPSKASNQRDASTLRRDLSSQRRAPWHSRERMSRSLHSAVRSTLRAFSSTCCSMQAATSSRSCWGGMASTSTLSP